MRGLLRLLTIVILTIVLYLLLWPVDIQPGNWTPPLAPDQNTGPYTGNDQLKNTVLFSTLPFGEGPEDIAVDSAGNLYAGLLNGQILRFNPDGTEPEVFSETGGRPLGLHFDSAQFLIVADADKGLLSINPKGEPQVLSDSYRGEPFTLTDDLDIAEDGTIYFSDASSRFSVHDWRSDIVEHQGNGSLYAFNPTSGETSKLLGDLYFANGVAVSPDQRSVLVVETTKYRIQRYWLKGPKAGTAEIFVENLPGFPDGVSRGESGVFWVALPNRRNTTLDAILPKPFLRKIVYRLPESLQPQQERYGMVLGFDTNGQLVHNLQEPSGRVAIITSVQEEKGYLYLGSLSEPSFGRYTLP
ncbi:MAG: SMP-30/gluconolactonase/LRE family protein [Bacteroidota bacterium]